MRCYSFREIDCEKVVDWKWKSKSRKWFIVVKIFKYSNQNDDWPWSVLPKINGTIVFLAFLLHLFNWISEFELIYCIRLRQWRWKFSIFYLSYVIKNKKIYNFWNIQSTEFLSLTLLLFRMTFKFATTQTHPFRLQKVVKFEILN